MNQRQLQSSHTSPGCLRGLTAKKKKIRNREGWREGVPERPCPEASLEARPLSPQTAPRALAPGAFLGLKRSHARCLGFRVSAADRNLGGRSGLVRHSARLPRGGVYASHLTAPHTVIGRPTLDSPSRSPLPRRSPGTNGGRQDIPRHGGPLVVTPCGRKCPEGPAPLASITLYLHLAPEYPAASQRGWQKKPLDGRFLRSHESTWGGSRKGLSRRRRTAARSHP